MLLRPSIFQYAFFLATLAIFFFSQGVAAKVDFSKERQIYKNALENLQKGQWRQYLNHKERLRNYPLLAYLEYEEILKEKEQQKSVAKLHSFIKKYPYFPHLSQIKKFLVDALYLQKDWQAIFTHTDNAFMPCVRLAAWVKIMPDEKKRQRELADRIWQTSSDLDERCTSILQGNGFNFYKNNDLVWERVMLAVNDNQWGLALSLRHHLSPLQKTTLSMLMKVRHNPERIKQYYPSLKKVRYHCDLITYALTRYPQKRVTTGYKDYRKYARKCQPSPRQHNDILYYLGLRMTFNGEREGLEAMRSLNPQLLDEQQHQWRARSHIKFEDWRGLIRVIDDFPSKLARSSAWIFWRGYAWAKQGNQEEAQLHYNRAAVQRNFYGFLAAEMSGRSKVINNRPANMQIGEAVFSTAPFLRFMELVYLDEDTKANREWENMLGYASRSQILALAGFAHDRKEYYLAIRAFTKAQYWDDLQRRYPLPYSSLINKAARSNRLDPALLYAIMRRESSYRPKVRSSAGAVGLLQVLPSTAREVKRRHKYRHQLQLIKPEVSIDIGSLYLRQLFDTYQGNHILALAAYNAGPFAVSSWLPEKNSRPAVEWMETISFGETRNYLRNVLFSWVIFEWRLGNHKNISLLKIMPDINYRYR